MTNDWANNPAKMVAIELNHFGYGVISWSEPEVSADGEVVLDKNHHVQVGADGRVNLVTTKEEESGVSFIFGDLHDTVIDLIKSKEFQAIKKIW